MGKQDEFELLRQSRRNRDSDAPELAHDNDFLYPKISINQEYADYAIPQAANYDRTYPEALQNGHQHNSVHAMYATDDAGRYPAQGQPGGTVTIKRRTLLIIIIVLLLLLIGVGLGVGLGLGLRRKSFGSSDPSSAPSNGGSPVPNGNTTSDVPNGQASLVTGSRTGIAATPRGDSAGLLMYFQAANGSLVENFYENKAIQDLKTAEARLRSTSQTVIDVLGIVEESPLAAVSYSRSGQVWRHVFYTDNSGQILEINSSSLGGSWSSASVISDGRISAGAPGLAACWGAGSLNTMRVIYGNLGGYHQILEKNFTDQPGSQWRGGKIFPFSDKNTGSACTIMTEDDASYVNAYFRNFSDSTVAHWSQRIDGNGSADFTRIREATINDAPDSDLAVYSAMTTAVDAQQRDTYVFYQGPDNTMKQVVALASPPQEANGIRTWDSGRMVQGTKMAAAFVGATDQTLVVFYQSNSTEIQAVLPNRNGAVLKNTTVLSG